MKSVVAFLFLFLFFLGYSQEPVKDKPKKSLLKTEEQIAKELSKKAPITSYRYISIEKDTTFVDTSLTIQDEKEHNFLRKDIFGLLPFANEGQSYTTLQYGLSKQSALPSFGFKAKHFDFQEKNDINYYSVATPLTELYFKTVMEQGQSLDALIAINTSENFNFSFSYKGLRSKGKYINQLVSSGNFRLTTSYFTKNKRYFAKSHFTSQDLLNGENGGIIDIQNFETNDAAFSDRLRLTVFLTDANTLLKGQRFFLDHKFQLNAIGSATKFFLNHQVSLEEKRYEYNQTNISSIYEKVTFNRFGDIFTAQQIKDVTQYKSSYNKAGFSIQNNKLGSLILFAEDLRYNQFYQKVVTNETGFIPSRIKQNLNSIGAAYNHKFGKFTTHLLLSNSISTKKFSTIDAHLNYTINDKNNLAFHFQKLSKLPDNNYQLHQSSYINYNWFNTYKNEKINTINLQANTQWLGLQLKYTNLLDHLYFIDTTNELPTKIQKAQLLKPKQYDKTINYISLKANKEFKFWKLALDNTILFQQTTQKDTILNLPKLVTRNTLYFSNHFFKKALFIQSGITVNYFTRYYAQDYNPVIGEFATQTNKQIGNFPTIDFFINGRIRQARIFLKAEHFNSVIANNNTFLNAPNYPYRDFIVRFGLVWNFFQ